MRNGQDESVIEEPAYLCCHALMHSYVRMHFGHKPRERPRRVQYFSWKQESWEDGANLATVERHS